ncbi:muscarinic acetylcholine receptor M5-like isoform X2 [Symsagittifera roscoffensis]
MDNHNYFSVPDVTTFTHNFPISEETPLSSEPTNSSDVFEMYQYQPIQCYIIIGIVSPIILIAVLGNLSVILSFCKDRRLRTPTNFPLISLTSSDLLVVSFTFPMSIYYKLSGKWTFGSSMCIVWLCSDYIATSTSVLSLIIVTFDRYMTITKFQKYKHNIKNVMRMISFAWLIPTITYVPITVVWPYVTESAGDPQSTFVCDEGWRSLTPFMLCTTVIFTYMPLSFLIFFNAQIYLMIRANAEKLKLSEVITTPQVELPEIVVQEPTVVQHDNEQSRIMNMQLADYSDDYSDTSTSSRRSTSTSQKNWSLLRHKFVPATKDKTIESSRRATKEKAARILQMQQRQMSVESRTFSANAIVSSVGSCGTLPVEQSSNQLYDRDAGVEHQLEDQVPVVMSFRPQRPKILHLGSSIDSNQSNQSNRSEVMRLRIQDWAEENLPSPRFADSPIESNASGCSDASQRGVTFQTPKMTKRVQTPTVKIAEKRKRFTRRSIKRRAQNRFRKRNEASDTLGTDSETEKPNSPPTVEKNKQRQTATKKPTAKEPTAKEANKSTHVYTQCSHETGQRQLRRHHRNKRIFKLIVILVSIYISCWCPYSFIACLKSLLKVPVPQFLFDFSVWILYFNSCLNPILYVWRNRAFRTAFVNLYKMRPNNRMPHR